MLKYRIKTQDNMKNDKDDNKYKIIYYQCIGITIKQFRNTLNLTAIEVAKALNMHLPMYYKYERGNFAPNIYQLMRIIAQLNVSVDMFFKQVDTHLKDLIL